MPLLACSNRHLQGDPLGVRPPLNGVSNGKSHPKKESLTSKGLMLCNELTIFDNNHYVTYHLQQVLLMQQIGNWGLGRCEKTSFAMCKVTSRGVRQ